MEGQEGKAIGGCSSVVEEAKVASAVEVEAG